MDYEKLIEQLKQKDGLWCSVPTGEKLVTDAADALTALLAENEKLRDEAEGMRSNWYKAVEAVKNLRAEQEKAKTEITRLKHYEDKCHDCPIVCAKTEIIKAHEELEQIQSENKRLKNKLSELAHLPFDEPGIGERTRLMAENESLRAEVEHWKNAHHQAALNFQQENRECNKVLAELEQVKRELQAYKDTGLEPEDFKRAFHEDAVLKLAGQALGIAPDRLRELAQAHKENRVLPEGSGWFVTCNGKKLTIVMDIEAALRRKQDG